MWGKVIPQEEEITHNNDATISRDLEEISDRSQNLPLSLFLFLYHRCIAPQRDWLGAFGGHKNAP